VGAAGEARVLPFPLRHFGLKLLEDIVKARWNSMVAEEKIFIKESLMKLMSSGTGHITTEHLFMKDALARCPAAQCAAPPSAGWSWSW
jgi:hypothetical protein